MIIAIKELKYFTPILHRIKIKPTWFNWFPRDKGILEFEYCELHGDFFDLAKCLTTVGVKFRVDQCQ